MMFINLALLCTTLASALYCFLVDRRIKRFAKHRQDMSQAARTFGAAIDKAEEHLKAISLNNEKTGARLLRNIDRAELLVEELRAIRKEVEAGIEKARRAKQPQAAPQAAPLPPAPVAEKQAMIETFLRQVSDKRTPGSVSSHEDAIRTLAKLRKPK